MSKAQKKSNYRKTERKKVIALLKNTDLFNGAESGALVNGKERDHALKDWTQNFWPKLKDKPVNYFKKNGIAWNIYAQQGHVLSSQVSYVNHLFPIRHDQEAVLQLAKTVCADFTDVLPITTDKYLPKYIQFEAISSRDHLNEDKLTRGCNCTSIDALIHAVRKDGKTCLILNEWKSTEKYNDNDYSIEMRPGGPKGNELNGKRRLIRYGHLINESAILKTLPSYRNSIYFFEPFYQLMRQTLWAEQMILHKAEEKIQADDFIHVHVVPSENAELLDRKYKLSQKNLKETWLDNLLDKGKYVLMSPMDLMQNVDKKKYGDLLAYLQARYWRKKEDA